MENNKRFDVISKGNSLTNNEMDKITGGAAPGAGGIDPLYSNINSGAGCSCSGSTNGIWLWCNDNNNSAINCSCVGNENNKNSVNDCSCGLPIAHATASISGNTAVVAAAATTYTLKF